MYLLLLSASMGSEFMDETQTIPAGNWSYFEIPLHPQAARIIASYEVVEGPKKVRLALMLREDLERIGEDLPGSIAVTHEGRAGAVADTIRRSGDFALVLDNRGKQASKVRLRVWLDRKGPEEKRVPRQRQVTVVALSLMVFFGILGFSSRKLLQGMRG